jgi:hypothetical protein
VYNSRNGFWRQFSALSHGNTALDIHTKSLMMGTINISLPPVLFGLFRWHWRVGKGRGGREHVSPEVSSVLVINGADL